MRQVDRRHKAGFGAVGLGTAQIWFWSRHKAGFGAVGFGSAQDYWQDRVGIAYQQADFSDFFPCLRTFSYQSRMTLPFEWIWVPRNFMICLYDFESFQYPAFTTSFTNRSTGAVCCSTVFDVWVTTVWFEKKYMVWDAIVPNSTICISILIV